VLDICKTNNYVKAIVEKTKTSKKKTLIHWRYDLTVLSYKHIYHLVIVVVVVLIMKYNPSEVLKAPLLFLFDAHARTSVTITWVPKVKPIELPFSCVSLLSFNHNILYSAIFSPRLNSDVAKSCN
jgi:hypothetical protein